MTLADAMTTALADLRDLDDPLAGHIAVIALSPSGEHAGYSYREGEHYVYLDDAMAEPDTADMVQMRLQLIHHRRRGCPRGEGSR